MSCAPLATPSPAWLAFVWGSVPRETSSSDCRAGAWAWSYPFNNCGGGGGSADKAKANSVSLAFLSLSSTKALSKNGNMQWSALAPIQMSSSFSNTGSRHLQVEIYIFNPLLASPKEPLPQWFQPPEHTLLGKLACTVLALLHVNLFQDLKGLLEHRRKKNTKFIV